MTLRHLLLTALLLVAAPASALELPLWEELTKTQKMLDADRTFVEAMRKIHQYLIMSAPTTGQEAALAAFTDPASEEYVQQMVASYDTRRRLIVDGLNSIGLDCFEPKGAFYAFPSIRITGMNEHEFCERLLVEEHVAVIPGSAFGCGGEGHVRCAYAASIEHIEKALERMHRFIRRHA